MKITVISVSVLLALIFSQTAVSYGTEDANSPATVKEAGGAEANYPAAEKEAVSVDVNSNAGVEKQPPVSAPAVRKKTVDANTTTDANAANKPKKKPIKPKRPKVKGPADANAVAGPNEPNDPNSVVPDWMMWLERDIDQIENKRQTEMREWTSGDAEKRLKLIKAVQDQIAEELNFIHEIAVEEGAQKTAAAAGMLLKSREKQFDEIIKKLEDARKKELLLKEQAEQKERERRLRERDRR